MNQLSLLLLIPQRTSKEKNKTFLHSSGSSHPFVRLSLFVYVSTVRRPIRVSGSPLKLFYKNTTSDDKAAACAHIVGSINQQKYNQDMCTYVLQI